MNPKEKKIKLSDRQGNNWVILEKYDILRNYYTLKVIRIQ